MKFYIFLSLLLMCQLAAVAGDLHDIFPTDDGKLFIYSSKESHLDPKKIAAAAKDRESLPALKFPEGNWGDAINGCQLSLRFEKSRYASNERINAIILIRNTTNYIISFMENDMIVRDGFDLFQITTSTGEVFSPKRRIHHRGRQNRRCLSWHSKQACCITKRSLHIYQRYISHNSHGEDSTDEHQDC
jgi:hypothetical protein